MKRTIIHTFIVFSVVIGVFAASAMAQSKLIINPGGPDQQVIDLLEGEPVNINPLTGDIGLFTDPPDVCSAEGGGTEGGGCDGVTVAINAFTVNGSSDSLQVNHGQSLSIAWNSRGAWSCAGSGLSGTTWNGTGKNPSGTQSVSSSPLSPGKFTVALSCNNGPVSDVKTVSLTLLEQAALTRDTRIIWNSTALTRTWQETFGLPFPRGGTRNIEIDRDKFAALEFNTGDFSGGSSTVRKEGTVVMTAPSGSFGVQVDSGLKLWTISQTMGDFGVQSDPGCRGTGNPQWKKDDGQPHIFRCNLQPNTTYFLNIVYTDQPDADPIPWVCTGGDRCGAISQPNSTPE